MKYLSTQFDGGGGGGGGDASSSRSRPANHCH